MSTKHKTHSSTTKPLSPRSQRDILQERHERRILQANSKLEREVRNARLAARDAQYEANFGHIKPRSFVSDGVVWRNYGTVPACSEPKMRPILREVC